MKGNWKGRAQGCNDAFGQKLCPKKIKLATHAFGFQQVSFKEGVIN